jgi:ParB family transcriptional regulator, chromosome partitioning protein
MERKALGRGLNALLRTVETTTTGLEQVRVDQIDPNPFQPRREFPQDALKELADSIQISGIVQPVLVRPADGRFQMVAGERRWRAARLAGLETIPALVRGITDRDALELALTENLLREDLNPLEIANAYQALQQNHGLSHEQIADRLGINRSSVTNTLRLLRLPPEVQEMLSSNQISFGHARALLALESVAAQIQLANMIRKRGMSVRQAESMVALKGAGRAEKKTPNVPQVDPNTKAAVLELERTLGTRVSISGSGVRGKIEISYFSSEDLNRIYDWIVRH